MDLNTAMQVKEEKRHANGMHLTIELFKIGCEWQGDMFSRKWAECLFFAAAQAEEVYREVENYTEGETYKFAEHTTIENGGAIYLA